jgi:hypothetical protein
LKKNRESPDYFALAFPYQSAYLYYGWENIMANLHKGFKRLAWAISILSFIAGWVLFFPERGKHPYYYIPIIAEHYNILDLLTTFIISIALFMAVWLIWYLSRWVWKGFIEK